jgi:hypothetical protein
LNLIVKEKGMKIRILFFVGNVLISIAANAQLNVSGDGYCLNYSDTSSNCLTSSVFNSAGLISHGGNFSNLIRLNQSTTSGDGAGGFNGLELITENSIEEGVTPIWFGLPYKKKVSPVNQNVICDNVSNYDLGVDMSEVSTVSIELMTISDSTEIEFYLGGEGQWFPTSSTFNDNSGGKVVASMILPKPFVRYVFTFDFDSLNTSFWQQWSGKNKIQSIGFISKTPGAWFDISKVLLGNSEVTCPKYVVTDSITTIDSLCGEESINIQDQNLLNALLAYTPSIDVNGDSIITYNEALAIDSINLSFQNILLFTGLEAFKNLKSINISNNLLSSLDASQLIYLTQLIASNNQLTSLITFTKSDSVIRRTGTENTVLLDLDVSNNEFSNLDLSIYSSLNSFDGSGNSQLQEICVTQGQVDNKVNTWQKDETTNWSTSNCARVTSAVEFKNLNTDIFPNPSSGIFTVSSELIIDNLTIYDQSGRLVKTISPSTGQKSIEVQLEKSGVYFVHVHLEGETQVLKAVVVK